MNRTHSFLAIGFILIALIYKASSEENIINKLEASRLIPSLERGNSLIGTDSNHNNIRDDIEQYIKEKYPYGEQSKAAEQLAKSLNSIFFAQDNDINKARKIVESNSAAINCIYMVFINKQNNSLESIEPAQVVSEIESITFNTKERLLKYIRFNKMLDGTSWSSPDGNTCH
ncbi:Uncharacterised protein [Plesiomonas shigelloides]|uniref:hypothetical protein n=1 Tax=Plesiomonas shigelloides TaxID=703 RepID=UPI0007ED165F|nr:hypothetical protein [Plesiomonas shigelloides]PVU64839.1 hypothetical protein C9E85_16100 [Plesiomonas shigelloides]SBT60897.1 Uncharacterised protein [Plesiomonas shigelloides]